MPCTAVYLRNRSTLACLSCSSRTSTAAGPSSPVIASMIDWRVSGDRDGVMAGCVLPWYLADEVAAVDHQDVAVDVIRGPAGQEDHRPHQVRDLPPAGRGNVLDDAALSLGIGPGRCGDGGLEVSRRDGVDLDVAGR